MPVELDLSIEHGNTAIIDERMLNIITNMFASLPPREIKMRLKDIINSDIPLSDVFAKLDEEIYLHKFTQKLTTETARI